MLYSGLWPASSCLVRRRWFVRQVRMLLPHVREDEWNRARAIVRVQCGRSSQVGGASRTASQPLQLPMLGRSRGVHHPKRRMAQEEKAKGM